MVLLKLSFHKPMIFKISKCSGFFSVVVVCLIQVYIFCFCDMTSTTGPPKKIDEKAVVFVLMFCFTFWSKFPWGKIQVSLGKDPSFLGERSKPLSDEPRPSKLISPFSVDQFQGRPVGSTLAWRTHMRESEMEKRERSRGSSKHWQLFVWSKMSFPHQKAVGSKERKWWVSHSLPGLVKDE